MSNNIEEFDSEGDQILCLVPENHDETIIDTVDSQMLPSCHDREPSTVESWENRGVELVPEPGEDSMAGTPAASQEQNVQPSSPSRASVLRRNSTVQNYLRSPTARRFLEKNSHCFFCQININGPDQLENHLRSSDSCASLYKRKCKVRSLESVLLHVFYCLFCNSNGPKKFQYHLELSHTCFEQYCQRYGLGNIRCDNTFLNCFTLEKSITFLSQVCQH